MPDDSGAWFNLGTACKNLQRYDGAIEAFQQALRIKPKMALAWASLGATYYFSGNKNAALDVVKALRPIDSQVADELAKLIAMPEDADAWLDIGLAYSGLQRHSDAVEAYRKALRIDPDHALAWYDLAMAYLGLQRHSDAIEAFQQALRIKPDNALTWYNLGIVYNEAGNNSAALDVVKTLRRLDPEKADTLFNLIAPP
jgi:cytochrome c-type biogenesis protein CcmH/NrfG